jgi:protease-4
MSANRKWTPDERAAMLGLMTEIYDVFLGHVVDGRKLARADVEKIAQGRVWNGADAKERGLVDELGGLDAAIAWAQKEGGVPVETDVEYWPGDPTLKDILSALERSFDAPFGIQLSLWIQLPAEVQRLVRLAQGFTTSPIHAISLVTPF